MAATVVNIAASVKRYPLDTDHTTIVGRANVLGNIVYVAFPGSQFSAAVLHGVFFLHH